MFKGLMKLEFYGQILKKYRGAGKYLARAGRKQANVSVRMARISLGALPCRNKELDDSSRLDVVEIARVPDILPRLFPSWSGLRTYQHPGTRISDIMEIRPVRTELFYADRQTDRRSRRHDEADGCFSQFCERAPKMSAWRRLSESCNMQNNSIKLY